MFQHMRRPTAALLAGILCLASVASTVPTWAAANEGGADAPERRVLLLSIDGFHALDLGRYVRTHPASALAQLSSMGVTYTNASTSRPSDSFPGLLALVTGGSPVSTGVWYDDSYDRLLSPPGSNCATKGTEVLYDESIDKDPTKIDGGGGIDPTKLPLDPTKGCTPVYPHSFLRVNTIFEIVRAAGGRTAWADKHLAYDLVNGPSGKGVDDLYTPEIAVDDTTSDVHKTEANDDLKVQAILNEIDGEDHTGTQKVGVPAVFGMDFQAVSVAQKLAGAGYADATGTPSAGLQDALDHTDQSVGRMVAELQARHLLSSTTIIVSAKHGQTPIDPSKHQIVDKSIVPSLVNGVQAGLVAQATEDDIALLWLSDQGKTDAAVAKLLASQSQASIQEILSGDSLKLRFNDPTTDSRTPDVIALPNMGVIYAGKGATKIAEHGGFNLDDMSVPILVANPRLKAATIKSPVETAQVAPTILGLLGLDANALDAVRIEKTVPLPGLALGGREE